MQWAVTFRGIPKHEKFAEKLIPPYVTHLLAMISMAFETPQPWYQSMARVPPVLSVLLSRVADSYSVRQSFSEDPLFPSEILVRKVAHSLLY